MKCFSLLIWKCFSFNLNIFPTKLAAPVSISSKISHWKIHIYIFAQMFINFSVFVNGDWERKCSFQLDLVVLHNTSQIRMQRCFSPFPLIISENFVGNNALGRFIHLFSMILLCTLFIWLSKMFSFIINLKDTNISLVNGKFCQLNLPGNAINFWLYANDNNPSPIIFNRLINFFDGAQNQSNLLHPLRPYLLFLIGHVRLVVCIVHWSNLNKNSKWFLPKCIFS